MGPIVTQHQGPIVPIRLVTFGPMDGDADADVLAGFAARLNDVCDDMGLPRERGRQSALAERFKVTNKAARKWLLGLGFPEMALAVRIATWGKVHVNWLLQGAGPKHIEQNEPQRVDTKALVLDEAVRALPRESGIDLIDNLRAKLERVGRLTAQQPPARYQTMLDAYEKEIGRKPH